MAKAKEYYKTIKKGKGKFIQINEKAKPTDKDKQDIIELLKDGYKIKDNYTVDYDKKTVTILNKDFLSSKDKEKIGILYSAGFTPKL